MIGIIIAVVIVIAVIVAFPVVGIILGVVVAAIIFFVYQSSKKQKIKDEEYKQFVQDTLSQHPEFGNYKIYYGAEGAILILSEEGYYGFFAGANNFRSGSIHDIKTIKYVTEPFEYNIKKNVGLLGKIIYRLEFLDFKNPIVDLPFGAYADTADKAAKKTVFAEVKSTFDYIKKNSKNKNLSIGSYTVSDDDMESFKKSAVDEIRREPPPDPPIGIMTRRELADALGGLPASELEELKKLFDGGGITLDEYETRKMRILGIK
jgi:hypothetical protein